MAGGGGEGEGSANNIFEMKNKTKTAIFTVGLSLITVLTVALVQARADESLTVKCSYLDPVTIDILDLLPNDFFA